MVSVMACVGLIAFGMKPVTSFIHVTKSKIDNRSRCISKINVLPPWADLSSVIAQLTLTPAVVYYMRNQMQEEVVILNQKVEDLEQTMQNSTTTYQEKQGVIAQGFSDDMRSALVAYQKLYGGTNAKIADVISNDEKRTAFEGELVSSISKLQNLAGDIFDLKKGSELIKSDFDNSLQAMKDNTAQLLKQQSDQGNI